MKRLRLLDDENAASRVDTTQQQHAPYPRKLSVVVLANVDGRRSSGAQSTSHRRPRARKREREVPPERPHVRDVRIPFKDSSSPGTNADHIAGHSEAPMQEGEHG